MKPSELKQALEAAVYTATPVFVWGAPGVGKSDIVRQVATDAGIGLTDVRALLLDPIDLRGLPVPDLAAGASRWLPPSFLPTGGQGILFLDELNAATPAVQAACYQLVLDRAVGEYRLPDGWQIIAAGNRDSDRAVTNRMPSPLRSRFMHLDLETDLSDWREWAVTKGNIIAEVVAFVSFRPALLQSFDPVKSARSYPCPRTWAKVSQIWPALPAAVRLDCVSGLIGEAAAGEFIAFAAAFSKMPNPDAVLLDPDNSPVPSEISIQYALTCALVRRVGPGTATAFVRYMERLPEELTVMAIRDAGRVRTELVNTGAFCAWYAKNGKKLSAA